MLVELVRIGDTGHVEGLGSTCESPQGGSVGLSNDVGRDAVTIPVPAGRDLSSHKAAEPSGLGDENVSALLELDKPLATFTGPDIASIAVLVLVLQRLNLGGLEGLEVVDELNLLVEDLLLRVVAAEQLRLCRV